MSVAIGAPAPSAASTATTAATALAALPPRPLESGRPFRMQRVTPRRSPSVASRASTATPAVFFEASRGSRPPSPVMSSIRTPEGARRAVTSSPGVSRAKPRTSKPHATVGTVAGAKAVAEAISADTLRLREDMSVIVEDRRDEVLAECAFEIVSRPESPVGARGRVVHIGRPRVDDPLPLRINSIGDLGPWQRRHDDLADFRGRAPEPSDVLPLVRQV